MAKRKTQPINVNPTLEKVDIRLYPIMDFIHDIQSDVENLKKEVNELREARPSARTTKDRRTSIKIKL